MDDLIIFDNLFEKKNDEIHFNLFKEVNIVELTMIIKNFLTGK